MRKKGVNPVLKVEMECIKKERQRVYGRRWQERLWEAVGFGDGTSVSRIRDM
jgi:hypothetical protein